MNVQADIAIHSASTKINKRITEFICKSITRPNMSHLRRKKKETGFMKYKTIYGLLV